MNKISNNFVKESYAYNLLGVFVLLSYVSIIGAYYHFTSTVLPWSDPFSYTLNFYYLLDVSHHGYFSGIIFAFKTNWYWLINILIAIFSPFLIKDFRLFNF